MLKITIGDIRRGNPAMGVCTQTHLRAVALVARWSTKANGQSMITSPVHRRNGQELPSSSRQSH